MVEDNVDDMDNWMEETMEFGDIMCINSVWMFCIEGGVVKSFADVWYIQVLDRFNVCDDDTKVHNIIKVEKDASKGEKKTNYILTNVIHHDVTDIHGLLLLVVLAIHSVLTTTHMILLLSHMLKI